MKINEIIREKERSLVIDTKAGCRLFRRINSCSSQMGKRSFPNKRILRNNLCLPACRILLYKRMTLEI